VLYAFEGFGPKIWFWAFLFWVGAGLVGGGFNESEIKIKYSIPFFLLSSTKKSLFLSDFHQMKQ